MNDLFKDDFFVDCRAKSTRLQSEQHVEWSPYDASSANVVAGITVAKDLACIVVIGVDSYDSIQHMESVMVTFTDGRAFRSVPYFNRWRNEFVLHDDNLEMGALERVLSDLCTKWRVQHIGYDPSQIPDGIRDRRAVAVDPAHAEAALQGVNDTMLDCGDGHLYPQDSAKEYMWENLPQKSAIETYAGGKFEVRRRVFPQSGLVARGRYDIVLAFVNAVAAAHIVAKVPVTNDELSRYESKRKQIDEGQRKQIAAYWESLPPELLVLVEDRSINGNRRLRMKDALPLLNSEKVRFIEIDDWSRGNELRQLYAWTGYKPITIYDDKGLEIETVRFD